MLILIVIFRFKLLIQGEVEGHVHEDAVPSDDSAREVVVEQLSVAAEGTKMTILCMLLRCSYNAQVQASFCWLIPSSGKVLYLKSSLLLL